jgi:hypothetical protein
LESTPAGDFVNQYTWAWPIAESLHFIGLCLLVGTVGLFDLRLLGFVKQIPLPALHRLIPWGVLGFAINILSGSVFMAAAPFQYLYNESFYFKVSFLTVAGINIAVFYTMFYRKILTLGAGDNAPLGARVIGAVSLLMWIGVMCAGRLLTFYRPSFRFF